MKHLEALSFVIKKHGNQKYGDFPYAFHLRQVLDKVFELYGDEENIEELMVVAALHDVLEDTNTTQMEIINLFGSNVTKSLFNITHHPNISYEEYLLNVSMDDVAKKVKVCDLLCNYKNSILNEKYIKLVKKYEKAIAFLVAN
jgi:(p)ppGpp synthase/HD superfamily hydrolase